MHESSPTAYTDTRRCGSSSTTIPTWATRCSAASTPTAPPRRERSGETQYRDTTRPTSVVGLIDPYVRARAVDVHRQATERRRITMRTMTRALQALAGVKGRKAMLLVSGGFVYEPGFKDMKTLVDASMRVNVPIHFIDCARPQGRCPSS